jgi:hypothetical protein
MTTASIDRDTVSFLNRDHVVLVTVNHLEISVVTTNGMRITIPASGPTLAKFLDELATDVQSNFVSIASLPSVCDR